jgi:hypothetical protein
MAKWSISDYGLVVQHQGGSAPPGLNWKTGNLSFAFSSNDQ